MNIDHVKEIEQNKFEVVDIIQWTGCPKVLQRFYVVNIIQLAGCPKVLQLCENGQDDHENIW